MKIENSSDSILEYGISRVPPIRINLFVYKIRVRNNINESTRFTVKKGGLPIARPIWDSRWFPHGIRRHEMRRHLAGKDGLINEIKEEPDGWVDLVQVVGRKRPGHLRKATSTLAASNRCQR